MKKKKKREKDKRWWGGVELGVRQKKRLSREKSRSRENKRNVCSEIDF